MSREREEFQFHTFLTYNKHRTSSAIRMLIITPGALKSHFTEVLN